MSVEPKLSFKGDGSNTGAVEHYLQKSTFAKVCVHNVKW